MMFDKGFPFPASPKPWLQHCPNTISTAFPFIPQKITFTFTMPFKILDFFGFAIKLLTQPVFLGLFSDIHTPINVCFYAKFLSDGCHFRCPEWRKTVDDEWPCDSDLFSVFVTRRPNPQFRCVYDENWKGMWKSKLRRLHPPKSLSIKKLNFYIIFAFCGVNFKTFLQIYKNSN